VAIAVLAIGGVALATRNNDDGGGDTSATTTPETTLDDAVAATAAENATTTTAPATTTTTIPLDEQCTDEIKANPVWACLTKVTVQDGNLILDWEGEFNGEQPSTGSGFHLHVFGSDGTNPPASTFGSQEPAETRGPWYVEDQNPSVRSLADPDVATAIGLNPKVCVRVGDARTGHQLVPDSSGGYTAGNCLPIVSA
jgi:hypothetical protein